jgi:hypothetical protein
MPVLDATGEAEAGARVAGALGEGALGAAGPVSHAKADARTRRKATADPGSLTGRPL